MSNTKQVTGLCRNSTERSATSALTLCRFDAWLILSIKEYILRYDFIDLRAYVIRRMSMIKGELVCELLHES